MAPSLLLFSKDMPGVNLDSLSPHAFKLSVIFKAFLGTRLVLKIMDSLGIPLEIPILSTRFPRQINKKEAFNIKQIDSCAVHT